MSTWAYCCWPGCRMPTSEATDELPLCERHYQAIGIHFVDNRTILSPKFAAARREHREAEAAARSEQFADQREAQTKAILEQTQVYYVRIGDHVKIGFSVNLRQRMASFHVPDDALLATEPGGREKEAIRHRQFTAERINPRRELFNPSPRLLAHIEKVRQVHGEPRMTGRPPRSVTP